jgi:hypothetical protein
MGATNALSKGVSGPLGPLTASFPEASLAGATVFDVTGLKGAEKVIMLSPADGRLAISSTGKRIVAGMVPSNAGTINVTLATSKGRLLDITVTVSALAPLNPMNSSAFSTSTYVYSLHRVNPAWAGACLQVRDSGNVLRTLSFNPDGSYNATGWSAFGDGINFGVSTWYDQSGNGGHYTATARPRLVFPNAPANYDGAYIDFDFKGKYFLSSVNISVGGTSNFAAFVICNTLGHATTATGVPPRPGTFSSSTSAPVISAYNVADVVYAAGDPKRLEGSDPSAATCYFNQRETTLDTTAIVGSGTARYRNFWFNQRGAVVDGGVDSRIAFTDRRHNMAGVTGPMQAGINQYRTGNFNGTVQEIIIFNGATPLPSSEALRIAKDQRTYWTGVTSGNYNPAADSYQPAVYGTISDGQWALASDGIFHPRQKSTQGQTYHASTTPAKSPDYPTTKWKWAFSNWYTLNDGSEPPEYDTGTTLTVRASLWRSGAFVQNLTFNGATEVTIASGADVFCDVVNVAMPASSDYAIVTTCKFNGTRPAQYKGSGIVGRDCATEAEMLGLLSGGTITDNLTGAATYCYGPSLAISDGWDGRAVPLIFGDSIAAGYSWVTYGLSSAISGQSLPYANFAIQGTRPANSYTIDAGIFRRKDQLLRAAIAINGGHPLWTAIISEHGVNDAGSNGTSAGNTLITKVSYFLKFAWYRYRPDKLVQTTYTPRVQPGGDTSWLYSYPDTAASTTSDPTNDRWIASDWIKTTQWPQTGYIDVRPAWTGSTTGTKWRDCAGTGTLSASVSIGANQYTASAAPAVGDIAVLDAGTSASVEQAGTVATVSGAGPYLITLNGVTAKAHTSGAAVRYATSTDGVHPLWGTAGWVLAATEVANAKAAGMFDKAA